MKEELISNLVKNPDYAHHHQHEIERKYQRHMSLGECLWLSLSFLFRVMVCWSRQAVVGDIEFRHIETAAEGLCLNLDSMSHNRLRHPGDIRALKKSLTQSSPGTRQRRLVAGLFLTLC